MDDLYSILGVAKTASTEEIKKAYRKLAMQHHPDRNSGDKESEEKFKEINMAYEILCDDSKRRQYDMFGSTSGASNPFSGAGFGGVDVDLGDIFNSFFGEGFSTRNKRKTETPGEDLQYNLNIDLKTSIFGGKEKITFNRKEECPTCHGEGGKGKKTCPKCSGTGRLLHTTQSIFGMIQQTVTCDECMGSGEVFEEVCNECHGEKRIVAKKELEIDVPAGIDSGMVIKLTGEGNAGIGTKAKGSLYVKFEVPSEEKGLVRDGYDLHYKVEIEVVEAVLGVKKEISIPIIGKRKIEIKAGTQNGNIVKISNDGVKHIDGDKKGDLYLEIFVKIPKKLNKDEKRLYEGLAKERNIEVGSGGVFDKIFG